MNDNCWHWSRLTLDTGDRVVAIISRPAVKSASETGTNIFVLSGHEESHQLLLTANSHSLPIAHLPGLSSNSIQSQSQTVCNFSSNPFYPFIKTSFFLYSLFACSMFINNLYIFLPWVHIRPEVSPTELNSLLSRMRYSRACKRRLCYWFQDSSVVCSDRIKLFSVSSLKISLQNHHNPKLPRRGAEGQVSHPDSGNDSWDGQRGQPLHSRWPRGHAVVI